MNKDIQIQFGQNAKYLTHMIDIPSDQVLLSQLSEQDYRMASFLDRRIITPQLNHFTVPWQTLSQIQFTKGPVPYYIFHIGHVGSTLISRLLGELPSVLAVREPQILRDLTEIYQIIDQANAPWSPDVYRSRRDLVVAWLSRNFHEHQRAIIKASSFVSALSEYLMAHDNKSLCLYVPLQSYLETILVGEGSRKEASHLAGARLLRLNKLLQTPIEKLWQLSHIQQIALGWLCEMATLMKTYQRCGKTLIKWQDFNEFLNAPADGLLRIAAHFELDMDEVAAEKLVSGPIMHSYSKAPEHDYSPDLRRHLLEQARSNHIAEITQTIAWVTGLAKIHPLIATIVNFAEQAIKRNGHV